MLSSHSKGNPGVSSPNNGLGLNSHESHESHKSGESTETDGNHHESDGKLLTDQPQHPIVRAPVRALLLTVVIIGIAVITYFVLFSPRPGTTGASPFELRTGAIAPDFELPDVKTGEPVKLSALRGRPVWINFWATWCPPCKAEMPLIQEKYAKYRDRGLVVVGIDMREDPAEVRAFTSANSFEWTFVVDSDGQVTNRYFMAGIPMHVFIDADGVIQALYVGDLQASSMEQFLGMIIN